MNVPEVSLPFLHPSGLSLQRQLSMAEDEASTMVYLVELRASSSSNDKQDERDQASFEWRLTRYIP